jgi:hypothetical protein
MHSHVIQVYRRHASQPIVVHAEKDAHRHAFKGVQRTLVVRPLLGILTDVAQSLQFHVQVLVVDGDITKVIVCVRRLWIIPAG